MKVEQNSKGKWKQYAVQMKSEIYLNSDKEMNVKYTKNKKVRNGWCETMEGNKIKETKILERYELRKKNLFLSTMASN